MKKNFLVLSLMLISTQTFANSMFICRNQDEPQMNVIFITQKQNVYSYKTPISPWSTDIKGSEISSSEKLYSFMYDDSNDTNRGYDIVVNHYEQVVSAVEWVGGSQTDTVVECILFEI